MTIRQHILLFFATPIAGLCLLGYFYTRMTSFYPMLCMIFIVVLSKATHSCKIKCPKCASSVHFNGSSSTFVPRYSCNECSFKRKGFFFG